MSSSVAGSSEYLALRSLAIGGDQNAEGNNGAAPNPLDSFCGTFYITLSIFSFDKAKELADKQHREYSTKHYQQQHQHHHHSQSYGLGGGNVSTAPLVNAPNWLILMTSLSHFAVAEKQYMNLTFLAPKGFLRKDSNLKSTMTFIKSELKKLTEPKTDEQLILREEILTLVGLRLDLMDFYEKLSLLGTAKNVEIIDLLSDIEIIVDKYNEEQQKSRSIAQSFFKSMKWEMDIVTNLLKAHSTIQNWEFLPSLISIQDASQQLTEWNNYVQPKGTSSVKKAPYYNSPQSPLLFQWIGKLKGALLSKFSVYFYEILAKNSNETYNVRTYCTKLQPDLYYRLSAFQKKSDALAVCLVLDARDTNFQYQHPVRVQSKVQGIESFPAILAIPSKPTAHHWPSIVMIISDRLEALNSDKFIGFYDSRVQATYFIMRVDTKMYLLTIYESKKSEKDNYVIKFMQEVSVEMKCGKIFSSLKCGGR